MYLTDPKTGEKSVTLTVFVGGVLAALLKLMVAGITIGTIAMAPFSGGDFAAVAGSLGAIYWGRRHTDAAKESE